MTQLDTTTNYHYNTDVTNLETDNKKASICTTQASILVIYIYADRNIRPCTIQGYTLAMFPKVTQYILCTTREETGKRTLHYSISDHTSDTANVNETHTDFVPKYPTIHSQRKHVYRDTFGDAHIQYHGFDNQDSLTFQDKYTALLQQELQNPYWNLHDPIASKSYQISKDMDIETMPHAMYFAGDSDTVTKINQVPYQTIAYNDNGMFTMNLMNDISIEIFIDNGATPSILPLHTYNKFPI